MNAKVVLVLVAATLGSTVAHAGEEDLVKYRENVMHVIGGHMGAIVAIVKGEVPYSGELGYHADSLAAVAPKALPAFETKAMTEKSEALEKIWDNWADFKQRAMKMETASAAFSKAVAGGKMAEIGAALGDLGKSCKGCHDEYMKEH